MPHETHTQEIAAATFAAMMAAQAAGDAAHAAEIEAAFQAHAENEDN